MLGAQIDKNAKTWEGFLQLIEFVYNRVVYIVSLTVHHLKLYMVLTL